MRHAPATLAIWSLLLATLVALLLVFTANPLVYVLLGGAAALTAALAAVFALTTRQRVRRSCLTVSTPDISLPAALLGIGVTGIAVGFTVGPWMTFIGAGLTLLAAAGLAREYRAQRRAQRAALQALCGALRERRPR